VKTRVLQLITILTIFIAGFTTMGAAETQRATATPRRTAVTLTATLRPSVTPTLTATTIPTQRPTKTPSPTPTATQEYFDDLDLTTLISRFAQW
jgi:hypothetical protein